MKTYTGEPYLMLSESELETISDFVRSLVWDASLHNKPATLTFSATSGICTHDHYHKANRPDQGRSFSFAVSPFWPLFCVLTRFVLMLAVYRICPENATAGKFTLFLYILMPSVLSAWAGWDPTAMIDPSRCCSALKGRSPMRSATTLIALFCYSVPPRTAIPQESNPSRRRVYIYYLL